MTPTSQQVTPEELAEIKRKCWWTDCKHRAIIEDLGSWRWCLYHFYYTWRWGHDLSWFHLKTAKLIWSWSEAFGKGRRSDGENAMRGDYQL